MSTGITVILGLGSNLSDRAGQLRDAIAALGSHVSDIRCSSVYESPALLADDAPQEWNISFLNMAIAGQTELEPYALLGKIKAIEQAQGRTRRGHWAPREIDIDILAYGNLIMNDATLVIPHRELLNRDFALIPLADIAPDWVHPAAKGKTARELAAAIKMHLTKTDILVA